MTDDQARRFARWQDDLTIDILEQSIPAIADDLADWYCRNHRPALDPASFPERFPAALLRRICAWCGDRINAAHGGLRRFRYSSGQDGRYYARSSKGRSLSSRAATSSRLSATAAASKWFS